MALSPQRWCFLILGLAVLVVCLVQDADCAALSNGKNRESCTEKCECPPSSCCCDEDMVDFIKKTGSAIDRFGQHLQQKDQPAGGTGTASASAVVNLGGQPYFPSHPGYTFFNQGGLQGHVPYQHQPVVSVPSPYVYLSGGTNPYTSYGLPQVTQGGSTAGHSHHLSGIMASLSDCGVSIPFELFVLLANSCDLETGFVTLPNGSKLTIKHFLDLCAANPTDKVTFPNCEVTFKLFGAVLQSLINGKANLKYPNGEPGKRPSEHQSWSGYSTSEEYEEFKRRYGDYTPNRGVEGWKPHGKPSDQDDSSMEYGYEYKWKNSNSKQSYPDDREKRPSHKPLPNDGHRRYEEDGEAGSSMDTDRDSSGYRKPGGRNDGSKRYPTKKNPRDHPNSEEDEYDESGNPSKKRPNDKRRPGDRDDNNGYPKKKNPYDKTTSGEDDDDETSGNPTKKYPSGNNKPGDRDNDNNGYPKKKNPYDKTTSAEDDDDETSGNATKKYPSGNNKPGDRDNDNNGYPKKKNPYGKTTSGEDDDDETSEYPSKKKPSDKRKPGDRDDDSNGYPKKKNPYDKTSGEDEDETSGNPTKKNPSGNKKPGDRDDDSDGYPKKKNPYDQTSGGDDDETSKNPSKKYPSGNKKPGNRDDDNDGYPKKKNPYDKTSSGEDDDETSGNPTKKYPSDNKKPGDRNDDSNENPTKKNPTDHTKPDQDSKKTGSKNNEKPTQKGSDETSSGKTRPDGEKEKPDGSNSDDLDRKYSQSEKVTQERHGATQKSEASFNSPDKTSKSTAYAEATSSKTDKNVQSLDSTKSNNYEKTSAKDENSSTNEAHSGASSSQANTVKGPKGVASTSSSSTSTSNTKTEVKNTVIHETVHHHDGKSSDGKSSDGKSSDGKSSDGKKSFDDTTSPHGYPTNSGSVPGSDSSNYKNEKKHVKLRCEDGTTIFVNAESCPDNVVTYKHSSNNGYVRTSNDNREVEYTLISSGAKTFLIETYVDSKTSTSQSNGQKSGTHQQTRAEFRNRSGQTFVLDIGVNTSENDKSNNQDQQVVYKSTEYQEITDCYGRHIKIPVETTCLCNGTCKTCLSYDPSLFTSATTGTSVLKKIGSGSVVEGSGSATSHSSRQVTVNHNQGNQRCCCPMPYCSYVCDCLPSQCKRR